jgi:hypothetical protein
MLMSAPAGVFRNSSISFVSTGRGVEYATRLSVTSFELLSAALAVAATAIAAPRARVSTVATRRPRIGLLLFSAMSIRVMEISKSYSRH